MNPNDYTLSVDQLHENFMREGCPYWEAFRGDRQSEKLAKFRPDTSMARTPEEVLIYSWMQLEDLFSQYPRGYAKIRAKKNLNDNISTAITSYVRWGDQVAGIGSTNSPMYSSTQSANAGPSWGQLLKMQEDSHKRELELVKDLIEAKFTRNQLEAELEGVGEPSLKETLLLKVMDLAPMLLGGQRIAPGQLGLISPAGEPEQQQPLNVNAPSSAEAATPSPAAARAISYDQLNIAANMIAQAIPAHHPNDVIAALALFCQQKPQEAAGYIDLLMSQIQRPDHG